MFIISFVEKKRGSSSSKKEKKFWDKKKKYVNTEMDSGDYVKKSGGLPPRQRVCKTGGKKKKGTYRHEQGRDVERSVARERTFRPSKERDS